MENKDYVTRINLKTATEQREKLIKFCLHDHDKDQFLAIGGVVLILNLMTTLRFMIP